jgi:hypothetical protein
MLLTFLQRKRDCRSNLVPKTIIQQDLPLYVLKLSQPNLNQAQSVFPFFPFFQFFPQFHIFFTQSTWTYLESMNSLRIFPSHFPHGQGKDPQGAMLAQSLPGTPLAAAAAAPVLRPCKSLPEGPPVEPRAPQGPVQRMPAETWRVSGCQW